MQDLANTVTTRTRFSLDEPDPIESSIEVLINGQLVNTGWFYDSSTNSVVFDRVIPTTRQLLLSMVCGDAKGIIDGGYFI